MSQKKAPATTNTTRGDPGPESALNGGARAMAEVRGRPAGWVGGRGRGLQAAPEPQIVMFDLGHAGILKIRFNCAAKLVGAALASSTSAPDLLGGTP
jgi:hypothetical protein